MTAQEEMEHAKSRCGRHVGAPRVSRCQLKYPSSPTLLVAAALLGSSTHWDMGYGTLRLR